MIDRSHTQRTQNANSGVLPIHGAMLQRKCACGGSSGLTGGCSECEKKKLLGKPLQTKLRINEPGDQYEQEADRVAAQVMRMAESDFNPSHLQLGATVQRRVAGGLANAKASMLQRQEAVGATPLFEGPQQTSSAETQDEGSACPSWFNDPERITERAAEHYVQNDMTPPSQASVIRIDCEPPRSDGVYACNVHFSGGLVIRVIVRKKDIVVGVPPFNTMAPPPATPLCFYNYECPDGQLILTKRECKSAGGPPLIVRRRAAPGGAGALDAAPVVKDVLATPGQPLDAAAQEFFSARFGHNFANVRVHADGAAAESARSVNALAYTVGHDIVFSTGQYAPGTRAGQQLLAHELTHVVQQSGVSLRGPKTQQGSSGAVARSSSDLPIHGARVDLIQRQPKSEGPTVRDLPIFLEKLELDVGQNLQDYGHHLYQAAILHPDEPDVLRNALSRYALGLNVLKDGYRFAGFNPDTANKLALGTGILFKGLTLLQEGEFTLDYQIDIGRGVKFETNIDLAVKPEDPTEVRKAGVNFGLVGRF